MSGRKQKTDGASLQERWSEIWLGSDAPTERESRWRAELPAHLPELLHRILRRSLDEGLGSRPRNLIMFAGFDPEPITLSALLLPIERLYLATTPEALERIAETRDSTEGAARWKARVVGLASAAERDCELAEVQVWLLDARDPASVFRVLRERVRDLDDSTRRTLGVDLTGGKKPMDAAAFTFASFAGLPAFYLDFDEYDVAAGRPKPWTNVYRRLPQPSSVFSLESRDRLRAAYDDGRYDVARSALHEMLRAMSGPFQRYFERSDLERVQRAWSIVEQAESWQRGHYRECWKAAQAGKGNQSEPELKAWRSRQKLLGDWSVWPAARTSGERSKQPPGPRLSDVWTAIAAAIADDEQRLATYIVDQYWRIRRVAHGIGDDPLARDPRAALIDGIGLAELLLDVLLYRRRLSAGKPPEDGRFSLVYQRQTPDAALTTEIKRRVRTWKLGYADLRGIASVRRKWELLSDPRKRSVDVELRLKTASPSWSGLVRTRFQFPRHTGSVLPAALDFDRDFDRPYRAPRHQAVHVTAPVSEVDLEGFVDRDGSGLLRTLVELALADNKHFKSQFLTDPRGIVPPSSDDALLLPW